MTRYFSFPHDNLSHGLDNRLAINVHGTMPQDLLKRFEVLKKCRNKFDCLVYEMLFIRALKLNLNVQSDSIRTSVYYVNFSRQNRFKCFNLHYLIYFYLDNGVMTTPKRRIVSFVFTVLCLNIKVCFKISEELLHDLRYPNDTDTISLTILDNTRVITAHKDLNIVCWDIEEGKISCHGA